MKSVVGASEKGKVCELNYDKSRSMLTISFSGFLSGTDPEGAKEFIAQYGNVVSNLRKEDTILVLDGKELKPFEQSFIDNLSELYKEYSTFKKVYSIRSNNPITNLQTKRLIDKLELSQKFILIDSIDEVE